VPITKTISLRILRPYYPPEIEAKIKAEKEKRKENGDTGSLNSSYYRELKKEYPSIIINDEFFPLLSEMQRNITSIYNRTISHLYHRLIIKKESISTAKALSEGPYRDFKSTFNSYIALGLRQKVQSNFRKKDLMAFKIALPTAKSDKFPIPIYMQTNFKIKESPDSDFIIELPLVEYIAKETKGKNKMFTKVEILSPPKVKNIPVILSTRRRKESGQWFSDEGTNAEIRRIISGEYKVSWIEIVKRTRFGKHDWFVNMVISFEESQEGLDPDVIGGIDIGVSKPLICAINNSLDRYIVKGDDIIAFNRRALSRRRSLLRRNRLKRSGHGSRNKLEPITVLTEKNERFKKSIMQRWAKEVAEFFKSKRASIVQMEELTGIKEREDFFSKTLRMYWNYGQLQKTVENKLREYGIEVRYASPKDTSRRCHSCGHINDYFTFEFRQQNNFPLFKCMNCGIECSADYNAARNIAIAR
jgi:IS605 OrfB family transposase